MTLHPSEVGGRWGAWDSEGVDKKEEASGEGEQVERVEGGSRECEEVGRRGGREKQDGKAGWERQDGTFMIVMAGRDSRMVLSGRERQDGKGKMAKAGW